MDIVDKEAAAAHFFEMKKARDLDREEYEKGKRQKLVQMQREVCTWLSAAEDGQEEFLEELAERRQLQTCDWALENESLRDWLEPDQTKPLIWVTGKPGGGKSVLASFLVQRLHSQEESTVLYFFCGFNSTDVSCAQFLRTLAFQSIQQNTDLVPLVHQDYLQKASTRSAPKMKGLLKGILGPIGSVHVVVDGVDECIPSVQEEILKAVCDVQKSSKNVKVLFLSRGESYIAECIPQKIHVSLNGQTDAGVGLYVAQKVKEIRCHFPHMPAPLLDRIENRMQKLAKGMFLWVYLVTAMYKDQASEFDLAEALELLPDGLDAVYNRILNRIRVLREPAKSRALQVLSWSCACSRPVKPQEIADGVSLRNDKVHVIDWATQIRDTQRDIIDLCAPLVEKSLCGHLEIVHFSAKQFLLDSRSGPFIHIHQAHFDIAMPCLKSLLASFIVLPRFPPQPTQQALESLMVTGYFGLNDYAHDYWDYHVKSFFDTSDQGVEHMSQGHDPSAMITLFHKFSRIRKGTDPSDSSSLAARPMETPARPTTLASYTDISSFIQEWINFKERIAAADTVCDTVDSQLTWQLQEDPTYLSLMMQKVCSIREVVTKFDISLPPDHIAQPDLARFQADQGNAIFQCRQNNCTHCCVSIEERLEHENDHKPNFPCQLCDPSGNGFRSRRDLDKHTRQYHRAVEEGFVPPELTFNLSREFQGAQSSSISQYSTWKSLDTASWNDKGRTALHRTLESVYRALAEHSSFDMPTNEGLIHSNSECNASGAFLSIKRKIDYEQYQSLADFQCDVSSLSQSVKRQKLNSTDGGIQTICDRVLCSAALAFPGFACTDIELALQRNIDSVLSSELEESSEKRVSRISNDFLDDNHQIGRKSTFWSKLEEQELPDLFAQHGSDFEKIADYFKTKTPEDVRERFYALIASDLHGLEGIVSDADARTHANQAVARSSPLPDPAGPLQLSSSLMSESSTAPQSPASEFDPPKLGNAMHGSLDWTGAHMSTVLSETTIPPQIHLRPPHLTAPNQPFLDVDSHKRPQKYRRPVRPAFCRHCNREEGGLKLRDDHTLAKHNQRFHSATRKVWLCVDVSIDKRFLSGCPSCRDGSRYRSKHNAATHLRNKHFPSKPTMDTLVRWMEEVEEPNPNHTGREVGTREAVSGSEKLPGIALLHALDHPLTSDKTGDDHPSVHVVEDARTLGKHGKLPGISLWRTSQETEHGEEDSSSHLRNIPLLDVSFDDILQVYRGQTTPQGSNTPRSSQDRPADDSTRHIAHQGFIRVDHVDKLPNLNLQRKAITRDQVTAYYDILRQSDINSERHEQALVNLKNLSERLLKDLRDWRNAIKIAPEIRPSFS